MLHDLTFLDPGKRWPPPSEKPRLDRYEGNRHLYESRHDAAFGKTWWWRLLREDKQTSVLTVLNFPRRLSNLWGDLLVGEPPSYKPGDEAPETDSQRLEALVKRGLNVSIREAGIDMSRFADGLFKVRLDERGEAIEAVSPELWFPVASRGDVRKIKHHVLAWTFEEAREDGLLSQIAGAWASPGQTKKYLYAEIHSPGQVEYRLHEVTAGGYIGPEAAEEKKQEFFDGEWMPEETHRAREDFLIVHVPNMRTTNRLFGHDDYEDIEGLVQEWEVRLGQISRVLDRHADPGMAGPPLEAPEAGSEEALRVSQGERYFTVEPDAEGRTTLPQYIVWDGSLEAAFKEIEELKEDLYLISETSPTAFGHSETGAAESGTSLRLRMQAPIAKASRLRTVLDPAVKEAIRIATTLSGAPIEDVQIAWKDGLPEDEKESTEIAEQRVRAKISSRLAEIMRVHNIDEDAAREMLEEINAEASASPAAGFGANGLQQGALDRTRQLVEGALNGSQGSTTPPSGAEPAE